MLTLQRDLNVDAILPCSANKKTGLKELWATILAASSQV
jgi:hypothetical protein